VAANGLIGINSFEALAAEWVGKRHEATTFRVRQAQPVATELRFEDAVFHKEIRDDLLLVPLEPPQRPWPSGRAGS
jgi:hypothetical protein